MLKKLAMQKTTDRRNQAKLDLSQVRLTGNASDSIDDSCNPELSLFQNATNFVNSVVLCIDNQESTC